MTDVPDAQDRKKEDDSRDATPGEDGFHQMPTGQFEAKQPTVPDSEIDAIQALPTMQMDAGVDLSKAEDLPDGFHNMRTMELEAMGNDAPAGTDDDGQFHEMNTMQVAAGDGVPEAAAADDDQFHDMKTMEVAAGAGAPPAPANDADFSADMKTMQMDAGAGAPPAPANDTDFSADMKTMQMDAGASADGGDDFMPTMQMNAGALAAEDQADLRMAKTRQTTDKPGTAPQAPHDGDADMATMQMQADGDADMATMQLEPSSATSSMPPQPGVAPPPPSTSDGDVHSAATGAMVTPQWDTSGGPADSEDSSSSKSSTSSWFSKSGEKKEATDGEPELGDLIGRWRLLRELGKGGMGAVYEAVAVDDPDKRVALKVVLPSARNESNLGRFNREAKALNMVQHENVIACLDEATGPDAEMPFIALEFVKGEDLSELLKRQRKLPVLEALQLSRRILKGLAAAHAAGVFHRDLKPQNILLGEDGSLKIADFGLARREAESMVLTAAGVAMGTPHYMSPEQIGGEKIGRPSDIYAFGAMLFHLVAGRPPFLGNTPMQVLSQHCTADRPVLHEFADHVPKSLSKLITACMEMEPRKRPASCAEILDDMGTVGLELEKLRATEEEKTSLPFSELKPGDDVGAYKIVHELGRGGMGIVYEAQHADHGSVALKVLPQTHAQDATALRRFQQEAEAASMIQSSGVAAIYSYGKESVRGEAVAYLAMELVGGRSLEDRLEEDGPIPEADAVVLMMGIAKGLEVAHEKGIVHRDLKPANILGADTPNPKVVDFGLARFYEATSGLTQGQIVGTPAYMSPEQGEGRPVGPPADIYSLGATIYHIVTGARPFIGDAPSQVIYQHCHKLPPSPRDRNQSLTEAFSLVIQKCLMKSPEDRYMKSADLLADLQTVGSKDFALTERRRELRLEHRRFRKRSPAMTLGIAAALVLISVSVVAATLMNQGEGRGTQLSRVTQRIDTLEGRVAAGETARDSLVQARGALEEFTASYADDPELPGLSQRLQQALEGIETLEHGQAQATATQLVSDLQTQLDSGQAPPSKDQVTSARVEIERLSALTEDERRALVASLDTLGIAADLRRRLISEQGLNLTNEDWEAAWVRRRQLVTDATDAFTDGPTVEAAKALFSDIESRIFWLNDQLKLAFLGPEGIDAALRWPGVTATMLGGPAGSQRALAMLQQGDAADAQRRLGEVRSRLSDLARCPSRKQEVDKRSEAAALTLASVPKEEREARTALRDVVALWQKSPEDFETALENLQRLTSNELYRSVHSEAHQWRGKVEQALREKADAELGKLLIELRGIEDAATAEQAASIPHFEKLLALLDQFPARFASTPAWQKLQQERDRVSRGRGEAAGIAVERARGALLARDLVETQRRIALAEAFGKDATAAGLDSLRSELAFLRSIRSTKAMVVVTGASSWQAGDPDVPNNKPHPANVPSFRLDVTEVTVGHYARFLESLGNMTGDHREMGFCHQDEPAQLTHAPADWDAQLERGDTFPVCNVNWFDASAFAGWAGKRLPKPDEWELAARGRQRWRYPWGQEWIQDAASQPGNWGNPAPKPVGSYPEALSPSEARDMAGNLMEWTSSESPSEGCQLRGGSFRSRLERQLRASVLITRKPGETKDDIGFRCVLDGVKD